MIFRLLALIVVLIMLYSTLNTVSRRFNLNRQQAGMLIFLGALLSAIVTLIALGRLPIQFILAPIGVAVTYALRMLPTLLRLLPLWQMLRARLHQQQAASGPKPGQASSIRTPWLEMRLRHADGSMDGTVLQGLHQGRLLSELGLPALLDVLRDCAADADSARLLEAYLDRVHPQWRGSAGQGHHQTGTQSASAGDLAMNRARALEILGLQDPVTDEQVVQAHRRLMQRMHPDRGGSDFLAKQINAARDFLVP